MKHHAIGGVLLGAALLSSGTRAAAAQIELRVLIVAVGDVAVDEGRAAAERLLDTLGVPYEVLDSSTEDLTAAFLSDGERGRFNGVLLTDSETFLPDGGTGFDAAEFGILHDYERTNGVREAVLSGFPVTDAALGLDYGMQDVLAGDSAVGQWQGRAGGTEIFEYVNTQNPLETEGFAFEGLPGDGSQGPTVEPLLVDADNPEYTLVSVLRYPDGREVLLSTLTQATFFTHTNVLAYEFLNFATSGLFLGARHTYLTVHNDDLFLPDDVWDPETNANSNEAASYRLTGPEVAVVANAQRLFREDHPLAPDLSIELAFNGEGANLDDELTQAIVANGDQFGFINHTFSALQMDWVCDDPDNDIGCTRTDYTTAFNDIQRNADVWQSLGLPEPERALEVLLTDSHSGLSDRQGTLDEADDIPFPEGFNAALGFAAEDLGIRVLASDASAPNQDLIQRVPGHELVLLPRYPTGLFYNATDPTQLVSEFNYIFHDSYAEDAIDPCSVSDALCETVDYAGLLDREASVTFEHISSYEPFPHYFHQTNLHVYDDRGSILQFDWLNAVLQRYELYFKLPLQSPRFAELGDLAWQTVLAQEAEPEGVLDTDTGLVTLTALGPARLEVTGLVGGAEYGGQSQLALDVSTEPVSVAVDAALDR
jgi:hypothetical protein